MANVFQVILILCHHQPVLKLLHSIVAGVLQSFVHSYSLRAEFQMYYSYSNV
jgi:hypothetical protein